MPFATITYDVDERIATVALNRPQARNGYTAEMADERADAVRIADADDEVRVLVLTCVGDTFCVGADLRGGSFSPSDDDRERERRPGGAGGRPIVHGASPAAVPRRDQLRPARLPAVALNRR